MKKIWQDDAWEDYLYWQKQDKKTLNQINLVIKDDEKNRIVYRITNEQFEIAQCGSHYRDK
jgi:toxin YoeB